MAPSVENYERILQADPRSRVFVELARALLERGDAARAADVCVAGLRHHPRSVQAHVLWGRALLALGRPDEAVARFEDLLASDPADSYAVDLAGEALLAAGEAARALPLLERGLTLHPGDRRVRLRTAEARRQLGLPPPPPPGPGAASPSPFALRPASAPPAAGGAASFASSPPAPRAGAEGPQGGAATHGAGEAPLLADAELELVDDLEELVEEGADDAGSGAAAEPASAAAHGAAASLGGGAAAAPRRATPAVAAPGPATAAEEGPESLVEEGAGAAPTPGALAGPPARGGFELAAAADDGRTALWAPPPGAAAGDAAPSTRVPDDPFAAPPALPATLQAPTPPARRVRPRDEPFEHAGLGAHAGPPDDPFAHARAEEDRGPPPLAAGSAPARDDPFAEADAASAASTAPSAAAPPAAPAIPERDEAAALLALLPDVPAIEAAHPSRIADEPGALELGPVPPLARIRPTAPAEVAPLLAAPGDAAAVAPEPAPPTAEAQPAGGTPDGGGSGAAILHPDATAGAAPHPPDEVATYEHELRARLLPAAAAQASFVRRHRAAIAAVAGAITVAAAAATFLVVRGQRRAQDAQASVESARKGLARDTVGALREAARVLEAARRADPGNAEAAVLSAEVAAVLAHDFEDAGQATLAAQLLAAGRAGESAPAVRWLLGRTPAERAPAASDALAARSSRPLARAVAGEILASRGEAGDARVQLEAAARGSPPFLRALADLGDVEAAAGDLDRALERFELALRAHPTHPRSVLGAAEVRLRLGRDLDRALASVEAIDRDPASAPPVADRLRLDLDLARLLAAAGRGADAEKRLAAAAARHPGRQEIPAAQAEAYLRAGDLDRALRYAEAAVAAAPDDPQAREALARLLLARGRYRELLASTQRAPTRTLLLYRGVARYELGELDRARGELEGTRRDGKMPAEAAAWMALAELGLGHRQAAEAITGALLAMPSPHPLALVARARLDLARGDAGAAERGLRDAFARDPDLLEGPRDLGRLLLARAAGAEAREVLQRAAARHRFDFGLRLDLGRARLAAGDAPGAVRELEAVVAERPRDPQAHVALSDARLAAGDAAGARAAAGAALEAAPRSRDAWLAAARAAEAQGDVRAARAAYARAKALGPAGADRAALAHAPAKKRSARR